jgi:hypothetical protein
LDTNWVETNFDKKFLSQVKNMSEGKTAFLEVPPGDDKHHSEGTFEAVAIGPPIKYQQTEGERTCMVYSMASAVHGAGLRQAASEIKNVAKKYEFKVGAFGKFINFLQKRFGALTSKTEHAATFDLLEKQKNLLIMACIRGRDGKQDHCICIYNDWIYDSNFQKALTLTRESLDVCCSSENQPTTYDGCAHVVSFPCFYNMKK